MVLFDDHLEKCSRKLPYYTSYQTEIHGSAFSQLPYYTSYPTEIHGSAFSHDDLVLALDFLFDDERGEMVFPPIPMQRVSDVINLSTKKIYEESYE